MLLSYTVVDLIYYDNGAVDTQMRPSDKNSDTQVTIRPVGLLFKLNETMQGKQPSNNI